MKYFFVMDKKKKRHVIIASDEKEAKSFVKNLNYIYELKEDTFNSPGFLISDP
jgi:hypothetical protein